MESRKANPIPTTDVVLTSGDVRSDIAIHYTKATTEGELSRLAVKYDGIRINGLADVEGYDKAKEAKRMMVGIRGAVELVRKGLKADVLVRGRAIDSEAKRLLELVKPIEDPLTEELVKIKVEQERLADEERARKQAIYEARMAKLAAIGAVVAPTIVAQMDDEEWAERYGQEQEDFKRREDLRKAAEAAEAKRKAEAMAEAERVRVEGERLAKERREFEAQQREAAAKATAEANRVQEANRKAKDEIDALRAEADFKLAEIERAKREAAEAKAKADEEARRIVIVDEAEKVPTEVVEALMEPQAPTFVPGPAPSADEFAGIKLDALAKLVEDVRTTTVADSLESLHEPIQAILDLAAYEIESLAGLITETK